MSSGPQKVAVAGGTGRLGLVLIRRLLKKGFEVGVLTRSRARAAKILPADVAILETQYNSVPQLTKLLASYDALVDVTTTHGPVNFVYLVDAALAAGITRYVPGLFLLDPQNRLLLAQLVFEDRKAYYMYLRIQCLSTKRMSFTLLCTGFLLDTCLASATAFAIDLARRHIGLLAGGAHAVPVSSVAQTAHALAAVLHADNAAATANRALYMAGGEVSQRRLAALAMHALGGRWAVRQVDVVGEYEQAMLEYCAGRSLGQGVAATYQMMATQPELLAPWVRDDNEMLGVQRMTSDEMMAEIVRIDGEIEFLREDVSQGKERKDVNQAKRKDVSQGKERSDLVREREGTSR